MLSYVLLAYWDAPRNSGVLPFSFHMFIHGYINCIEALHFHQLYDCNILYLLLKKNLYLLVVTGTLQHEQNSSSHSNGARSYDIWKGHVNPSFPQRSIKKNILFCLEGREAGANWSQTCSNGGHAGRNCERWSPFLEGWNSPAVQFEGPAVHVVKQSYLSWCPTSCAYTSSAPSAQPHDRVWISN
jgi:hypothetical protein